MRTEGLKPCSTKERTSDWWRVSATTHNK